MPNKGNLTDSELSVNVYDLDDKGREYVCNFLKWESAEKNIAISNIVFCCLEYCLLISGDKPSLLVTEIIRDRKVFIDTNIIFRALGINGHSRKNVILAFLRKCKQAKIEISVSDITKSEFWTTIDYYITQIMAFPRGKIYWNVLEDISDYNLYSFYDLWHYNHEFLSLNYFRAYLNSIYADFIKEFKIQEVSIQTQSDESINSTGSFEIYARDISECKKNLKSKYISEDHWISSNDRHDSTMIKYLELYRAKQSNAIDVFFVSSDKALRYWDMTREKTGYPVVVYPSQLFLILIKLCGRSEDDLESFVSFINIRPSSQQLSNEKANVILAGISSITEDIIAQKSIVAAVLNDNFQNIIKHSNTDQELYQNAQLFSQKYLEDELKSKEKTIQIIQNKQDKALAEVAKLTSSNQEKEKILRSEAREKESYKNVVCKLAEEKIIWGYCFRWYLVPILLVVYFILFLSFITFQFIYCDASWNFVNEILLYLDATTFGKRVSDYIYIIDSVLLALTTALYKFCWKNPFDHKQQEIDKALRIEKYLEKFFPERKDNEIED
jgi:hypothetical protein